mmetsp:Transcript_9760/g.22387  ORF Transcript_9760/g.22387 Transcript_9760/m.22387 type:complete len:325 (+) Transcript_9760:6709-7683(+)
MSSRITNATQSSLSASSCTVTTSSSTVSVGVRDCGTLSRHSWLLPTGVFLALSLVAGPSSRGAVCPPLEAGSVDAMGRKNVSLAAPATPAPACCMLPASAVVVRIDPPPLMGAKKFSSNRRSAATRDLARSKGIAATAWNGTGRDSTEGSICVANCSVDARWLSIEVVGDSVGSRERKPRASSRTRTALLCGSSTSGQELPFCSECARASAKASECCCAWCRADCTAARMHFSCFCRSDTWRSSRREKAMCSSLAPAASSTRGWSTGLHGVDRGVVGCSGGVASGLVCVCAGTVGTRVCVTAATAATCAAMFVVETAGTAVSSA